MRTGRSHNSRSGSRRVEGGGFGRRGGCSAPPAGSAGESGVDVLQADDATESAVAGVFAELRTAREALRLTGEELSRKLNGFPGAVSNWETRRQTPYLGRLVGWAREVNYRLTVVSYSRRLHLVVRREEGESWEQFELRRLAALLRKSREDQKISRAKLGAAIGVSGSMIYAWETRRATPFVVSLFAWAQALGCSVVLRPVAGRPRNLPTDGNTQAMANPLRILPASPGLRDSVVSYGVVPRGKAALCQQLNCMQLDLQAARLKIRIDQGDLARYLGVSDRTLRSWEKAHDSPKMMNLISWGGALGYRFVLAQAGRGPDEPGPVCLGDGESWETCEMRRLATTLRLARHGRPWSQGDLAVLLRVSRRTVQRWEDVEKWPRSISLLGWAARLDYRLLLIRTGSPRLVSDSRAQCLLEKRA